MDDIILLGSYCAVPKNIRLNSAHYFIMKIPKKQELKQIVFNHPSDIDLKTILFVSDSCYFYIRKLFTLQREYFRKNIKTKHGN